MRGTLVSDAFVSRIVHTGVRVQGYGKTWIARFRVFSVTYNVLAKGIN